MEIGDVVIDKNLDNNEDYTLYEIVEINRTKITIKGVFYRLIREVDISKIQKAPNHIITSELEKTDIALNKFVSSNETRATFISGKVLHIDGDSTYLNKCIDLYSKLKIYAVGINMSEKLISDNILDLVHEYSPDIVVITGHDIYNGKNLGDLNNYKNSSNFIAAIEKLRNTFSKDDVVVIAGACQSHFEALIASGANFASSPKRLNIHAYDPAIVAIKTATTHFERTINFSSIRTHLFVKESGIGGVETKGKMRLLYNHE